MLHLKFALNLENLADKMIGEISSVWNNPFEAPVVIFPDPKLEQWFRLRWMKKKGVLANLNKSTIDRFLFDILVGKDDSKKKLTAEMLTNVILAYLETDNNYKTLCGEGDDEVTRYLEVDGKLDYNHLFDFASKMASLFLDYETSRPKGFVGGKDGFLDKWNQEVDEKEGLFFTETKETLELREKWQRKLYSAIFHKQGNEKSLLEQVFDDETKRTGEKKEYVTIPYLFKACNEGNFKLDKLPKGGDGAPLPVFIFGLSGMGQFYRVILQKYATQYDVYAYIQNPCMEFWEDAKLDKDSVCRQWNVSKCVWKSEKGDIGKIQERMKVRDPAQLTAGKFETDVDDIPEYADSLNQENDLLASWGRSGRDNIKLWCQAADYDFDFKGSVDKDGNDVELPQDTLLHKVQYSIAHRENLNGVTEGDLSDKSLDVTAAPTKIREIENLHTQICALLSDKEKKVHVEDILVVSPSLDEYRTAISMVFDQTPARDDSDAKESLLHIPFSIVDSPARNSLTENALSSLFTILDQGSITRPEFFSLVRNPVVQTARKIKNEEVDAWQNWVTETNTYRDSNETDDWDKVKNRLLIAQMTSSNVEFDDVTLMPFSDLACSDKASLCRFIDCIDALEEWIEYGKNNCTDLKRLAEYVDAWIAMPNVPNSLKSEAIVYKRVADALNLLRWQNAAGKTQISMKLVEQSLLLAAQGTEYSCGNLFVNGITFMKFVPNRIIPVKHLFFIGAAAASFPGAKQQNTLDLRKSCFPWPGDDSLIARNRYAFLCQLMSTSEGFHLSYVNMDIKKDAELYPSSIVNDLRKFIVGEWKEKKISLDEDRKVEELFTPKSIRNKIAYTNLLSGATFKRPISSQPQSENKKKLLNLPERVTLYSLASFLKDPFKFRISLMLADEDEEDVEKEIFEPLFFNGLDSSAVLKKALAATLSNESDEYENFKKDLELKGKIPNGEFGKKQWKSIDSMKQLILDQMEMNPQKTGLVEEIRNSWSHGKKIQDLPLKRSDGSLWLLSGTLDWCNSRDIENVTEMIEVCSTSKSNENIDFDKYMSPYIKVLALIAYKGVHNPNEDAQSQKIDISIYSCDKEKNGPATTSVSMSPKEARAMLEKIYETAYGDEKQKKLPFSKAVPVSMIETLKEKEITKYKEVLLDGPWEYFDKKSLFDPLTDVGFSAKKFVSEWTDATKTMSNLIAIKKFVKPEEPKEVAPEPATKTRSTRKAEV